MHREKEPAWKRRRDPPRLHEEFDYMIEDLREQGQIKDLPYIREEKDNLINIVGNIVDKIDVVERENKNGEAFKVANFSVVSKDDEGNKVYLK